ncbi:hypothetical protein CONLIGDRAFT_154170 [Coniochaeta ligniaria NRRL 30616]|uniref:Endonuclease/exonuclease/phosphatase domain-containing protein n=1 Tax=Coniochaeta ligniaria NRRL 30616 TaxID=1408157 RepID=A0A1J7JS78_9PEZI|nr:hypothetical protein CONLIGDRAFT_154170 [Coniochaeta ligniaria NRRL 30616]
MIRLQCSPSKGLTLQTRARIRVGVIATLEYHLPSGLSLRIINIYNVKATFPEDSVLVRKLLRDKFLGNGLDLLVGDFNLHMIGVCNLGKSREGAEKRLAASTKLFLEAQKLCLITPPFLETFFKSSVAVEASTIDLAWAGESLTQLKTQQSWVEKWWDSDHTLVGHEFQLDVPRQLKSRLDFTGIDRHQFRNNRLQSEMNSRFDNTFPKHDWVPWPTHHPILAEIDNATQALADSFDVALSIVPTRTISPTYTVPTAQIRLLKAALSQATKRHMANPGEDTWKAVQHCKDLLHEGTNGEYERRIRQYRDELRLGKAGRTIHQWSRSAQYRGTPKAPSFMGGLKKDDVSTQPSYVTGDEKATACAHSIWTENGVSAEPASEPLQAFRYKRERHDPVNEFNCVVTPDEVKKLLGRLSVRKAPDKTGMSNQALSMLMAKEDEEPLFERYLADLFTACLYNSYFPDHWKTAVTHMVPKPGKDRYDLVKSWRPIALLSVVGKLLEKIVAIRFTLLTIEHGLLGRCDSVRNLFRSLNPGCLSQDH